MLVDNSIIGAPEPIKPAEARDSALKSLALVKSILKESLLRVAPKDDPRMIELEVYDLIKKLLKGGHLNLNNRGINE